jgi:hypothetical protein
MMGMFNAPYNQHFGGMTGNQAMQGMQGMVNPYLMAQQQQHQQHGPPASMPVAQAQAQAKEQERLQPYDSTKMKQGRMGHYGYLEGRGECSFTRRGGRPSTVRRFMYHDRHVSSFSPLVVPGRILLEGSGVVPLLLAS